MEFEFKGGVNVFSMDVLYDLFYGGYIRPEELLEDVDQISYVLMAIDTINDFLTQAEEARVLEVG